MMMPPRQVAVVAYRARMIMHVWMLAVLVGASGVVAQEPPTEQPMAATPEVVPVAAPVSTDTLPPSIVDVAAASDHPLKPPVITVSISDDQGPLTGTVFARADTPSATTFEAFPLNTQPAINGGAVLLTTLRDGLQTTGFVYFLEVKDAGNNSARLGSETDPLRVLPAEEATSDRLAREAAIANRTGRIHPSLIMLSFGVGVVSAAGAGAFLLDRGIVDGRAKTARTDDERVALANANTQDLAGAVTLGVVGAIALTTGVILLVVQSADE
jgi:hypothetical protein